MNLSVCLNEAAISRDRRISQERKTYSAWRRMMKVCYDKQSKEFSSYGEKGVIVYERWHNYDNFIVDIGIKPEGASLVRLNKLKGYLPGNVSYMNESDSYKLYKASKLKVV